MTWTDRQRDRRTRLWWLGWAVAAVLFAWAVLSPLVLGSALVAGLLHSVSGPPAPGPAPLRFVETAPFLGGTRPPQLRRSLDDRRVLAFIGDDTGSSIWSFDLTTEAWELGPEPPSRAPLTDLLSTADGLLAVSAGRDGCVRRLSGGAWSELGPQRCGHALRLLQLLDGAVLVWPVGGRTAWRLDTATGEFQDLPQSPRDLANPTLVADGQVASWIGVDIDLFDPGTGVWTSSTWSDPGVAGANLTSALALPDGRLSFLLAGAGPGAHAGGVVWFDPLTEAFERDSHRSLLAHGAIMGDGTAAYFGRRQVIRFRLFDSDISLEAPPWSSEPLAVGLDDGRVLISSSDPGPAGGVRTWFAVSERYRRVASPRVGEASLPAVGSPLNGSQNPP